MRFMPRHDATPMWERPEVVARFAARAPDLRLQALFAGDDVYRDVREAWSPPSAPRVLDIGCAGGRNTVWLADQGADVWALDASSAMVTETRERLSAALGEAEAVRRVCVGEMSELHDFDSHTVDLVLALGVFQDATSTEQWHATLAETARVLRAGGLCLVANFGPGSQPGGSPLTQVAGQRNVWLGFDPEGRRMTLPDLEDLDADFAQHGLTPALPSESVRVDTARGFRITLNALYRRDPEAPA